MIELVEKMFWLQNQTQLLHWKASSGFHHEKLGEFYSEINKFVDEFIEVYAGKVGIGSVTCGEVLYKVENDKSLISFFHDIEVLIIHDFRKKLGEPQHPLKTILDDFEVVVNKYKYLLLSFI